MAVFYILLTIFVLLLHTNDDCEKTITLDAIKSRMSSATSRCQDSKLAGDITIQEDTRPNDLVQSGQEVTAPPHRTPRHHITVTTT